MLALSLLISLQAGPHAALHPVDSDLYVELPGLEALTEGLQTMPLAQASLDPELREALRPWVDFDGLSGETVLHEALALTGAPRPVVDALVECARGTEGCSISLGGLTREHDRIESEIQAVARAVEQLEDLGERIEARTARADGILPDTLAELDLPAELLIDPWDQPIEYLRIDARTTYELFSLGSDRAPGGGALGADVHLGDPLHARALSLALSRLGLLVVLDFESPELALRSVELVLGALADSDQTTLIDEPPIELGDGLTGLHRSIELAGMPYAPRAWLARSGRRVAFGWGTVDATRTAGRAAGEIPSLARDEGYLRATAGVVREEGTEIARGFLRCSPLALFRPLVPLEAAFASSRSSASGSALLDVVSWITADDGPEAWRAVSTGDGRMVTESFAPALPSPSRAWFGTSALGLESTSPVPPDAMAVIATSIDGRAIGRAFLHWIEARAPGSRAELLAELGFDPLQDLFGNLGGSLVASCMPIRGLALPRVVVFVDLEDAESFGRALEALATVLADKHAELLRVQPREYRGVSYFTVAPAEKSNGPLAALTPCLALVEGRLMVTLTSSDTKREIKRLQQRNQGPNADETELHPLFRSVDLEEALSVASMDWEDLILGVESLVRAFGALASGALGDGFDVASLPSAELVTRRLRPTLHVKRLVAGGVRTRHESSFGPETWFGLPLLVAAVVHRSEARASREEPGPEPPAPEGAPDLVRTREVLAQVKLGLGTYRAVQGRFPERLEELVEGTESFPNGFLGSPEIPRDGWGRPLVYELAGAGAAYELRSVGGDGVDDGGAGDDVLPN